MNASSRKERELIDELLALPTPDTRAARLEAGGMLDPRGLDRLLDIADRLVVDDPGRARRLADMCAELACRAGSPATVPRASYVRAGAHGLNGELDEELRLTDASYEGYAALGMNLEALRTNVGKIAALLELGRYDEALDVGQAVLDTLAGKGDLSVSPTPEQADLLVALVEQNRGGCLEYMGRYEEALAAYAVAEEKYRALGMTERLGEIANNRGAVLSYLGRGNEALEAQESAVAIFREAGLTLRHAQALGSLGEVHVRLGNHMLALEVFEQERRLLAPLDALVEECFLLRNTADAYLDLNLYTEALAAYHEANDLIMIAGMAHDRAQALRGMGSTLVARSELEEAAAVLAEAANLFAAAGNAPLLSGVKLEQAALLAARGDRAGALATASRALELVSGQDWPVHLAYAHMRLGDLLLPDITAAEPHLLEAQRLAERLTLPQLRFRSSERLGRLRRLQGRHEEAQALLEAAVNEIERLRGTVAQDTMRASFLKDKTAAYEELLQLHLARNDEEGGPRRAFDVAERAKSRALVDLLTGIVERNPPDSRYPELEERLQELQAELNATHIRILGDEHAIPLANLSERAFALEGEISRLRLRIEATGPTSDPFAAPTSPDDGEELPSDVVMLAYHVAGDEIMAFVGAGDELRVFRSIGSVAAVESLLWQLDVQWEHFRAGREFVDRYLGQLERTARRILNGLYSELVAPLETYLERAAPSVSGETDAPHRIVLVPHGSLHRVPFHALFDGERYLIERFEVSYAPSARVYSLCQERSSTGLNKALVMGVADPLIPAAAEEARAVAHQLPAADVFENNRATTDVLQSMAPGHDVLHLACHGLFRSDNPMFSSLKLHDGWLTAAEVLRLDLSGALVVLSACESGRSEVVGGDEILGLSRAFLGAGAATLVVSLWLVQDHTTALLMERWYERLQSGMGRTEALRAAQLALKNQFPHPYYWAPFVLTGRR